MTPSDMQILREIFERSHIVLAFNGPFTQSVIEELGEAIRRHLESQSQGRKRIMDVFAVYIETTQNIRHYAETAALDAEDAVRLNAGTVLIAREGEDYSVIAGNLVRRADGMKLAERLDQVLALDAAGLKTAYKERLRSPVEPGAKGAGLGFLQMARKATRPMSYSLAEGDEDHDFFCLTVTI